VLTFIYAPSALHDYQAAILENQLRPITPEQTAGSIPNFNHLIYYWRYFMVSSQEVSTMALAISLTKATKTPSYTYQRCN
jgi:hypothetical protein